MRLVILTDNILIYKSFRGIIESAFDGKVEYYCSPSSEKMFLEFKDVLVLDIKQDYKKVLDADLVISCHCKKIFPSELVNTVRCINVHPGLNPFNRGWYPQVFAINNKLPHGATIHEMDEKIDHGSIIVQEKVDIFDTDKSSDVYNRVLEAEINLFRDNITTILSNSYTTRAMDNEGNYNSIQDFKDLCQIDMSKKGTFKEFYDLIRSLTHDPYSNAFFYDKNGDKVYISINIEKG